MHFSQAMPDDVGKADQDGQRYPTPLEAVDQLLQVDASVCFFGRVNQKMAVVSDGKVALAPASYVVELGGIAGCPAVGGFAHLGGGNFSIQGSTPLGGLDTRNGEGDVRPSDPITTRICKQVPGLKTTPCRQLPIPYGNKGSA